VIPARPETASSLRAAARLFVLDGEALKGFNRTIGGFWGSFCAVVFGLPYYIVLVTWPARDGGGLEVGPLALAVVLSWTLFPLIAAVLTRLQGLSGNYITYIIANNWAAALTPQPYLILALGYRMGLIGADLYEALQLVVVVVLLWYGWAVCRVALGASVVVAGGYVILASLIDILLSMWLLAPAPAA
jgi:hypothetical protein